jgi:hypothetical protein
MKQEKGAGPKNRPGVDEAGDTLVPVISPCDLEKVAIVSGTMAQR